MTLLFFLVIAGVTTLLTLLVNIYWLIPVWIVVGILSGYLTLVLSIPFTYPIAVLTKPTNKFKQWYIRSLSRAINLLIYRIVIEEVNMDLLPKDTTFVAYPNHKKAYDIFVVANASGVPMGFAAKKSVFKIPILAGWMRSFGCLEIDRENDRNTLKEIIKGTKLLEQGLSLTLFPEGTRSPDEEFMMPSRPGAYRLAIKAGVPVVPIALVGTSNHAKRKGIFKKIKMVVGKPLYKEDYDLMTTNEVGDYVFDTINGYIKEYSEQ